MLSNRWFKLIYINIPGQLGICYSFSCAQNTVDIRQDKKGNKKKERGRNLK